MSDVKKCDSCKIMDDSSNYEQITIQCGRFGVERKWVQFFDFCPTCYQSFFEYINKIKKVYEEEKK